MDVFLVKTVNCPDIRIPLILINIEIQNINYINRAKSIIGTTRINLVSNLKRRIVYRTFNIGLLLTPLHLNNDTRTVISLAEHVINRILPIPIHGLHLLIHEFQIHNIPVINNLIQELDHDILTGLLSKDQLKHIIVKQVGILKVI